MMKQSAIPGEFEDLLTRAGKRVLAGRAPEVTCALADPRRRFLALNGMIVKSRAEAIRRVLDSELFDLLSTLSAPIPPETIEAMRRNNDDWLPKTVRVKTAYLQNHRARAYRQARRIGLIRLLSSESFRAFAEIVLGRKLDPEGGQQVICYGAGDYSGPHTDHHPGLRRAAKGYLDIHVSLTNRAVLHQFLVYAKGGHWSELAPVHEMGCITVYRLPFWHMTTPLVAKPGQEASARRWLLLGTYFYKES